MKASVRIFSVALLAASLVPAASAGGHTHAPANSVWKLDISKTDFGGGPAYKSDEMTILTDTEKWLSFTDVSVDAEGKTWKASWSGPQNGTLKPIVGTNGGKASFKTADDSSHWVFPDGTIQDSVLTMSSDKKAVTIKSTVKTKDGKSFQQTLYYDRVK
jgi:hypothetical protein